MAASETDDATVDGRRARAERSREAVVDAILALLREGNRHPGASEIAERAGVSLRSVFRHFDDLETLWAVAVARHSEMLAPLFVLEVPGGATLEARVDAVVAQRARLYEEMRPVRVVAEWQSDRSEALQHGLARSQRILKDQVGDLFAPELATLGTAARRDRHDALDLAASYKAWIQLREDQGLSVARSQTAMRQLLHALLPEEGHVR